MDGVGASYLYSIFIRRLTEDLADSKPVEFEGFKRRDEKNEFD